VLVRGSSVAMVTPGSTSWRVGPTSRTTGSTTNRAMIDRWDRRIDSRAHASAQAESPFRTRVASAGRSKRSTNAQPTAAKRLDIEATWMSATS
jgi:hypothetical protein